MSTDTLTKFMSLKAMYTLNRLPTAIPKVPRQRVASELFFGFNSTEIFSGANRAPQGGVLLNVNGVPTRFILQTVAGSSHSSTERKRWVAYPVGSDTGEIVNNIGYSASLALNHQGAGGWVANNVAYLLSGMTTDAAYPDDDGKGFSVTTWIPGVNNTTQSNVVNYQVFGYAGSGHPFQNLRYGTAFNSSDNKYWILVCQDDSPASSRVVVVYESADILAAGPGTAALSVSPVSIFNMEAPFEEGLNTTQDGCCDGENIYILRGSLGTFQRHRIEAYSLMKGIRLDYVDFDSLRSIYGLNNLLDNSTLGIPYNIEPEAVWINNDNNLEVLMHDVWHTGQDIVSFEGSNYACISNDNINRDPANQYYWVKTKKGGTAPAWDPSTTYNATLTGAYTRKSKIVFTIEPFEQGKSGQLSLDSGIINIPTGATIRGGSNVFDLSIPKGSDLRIGYFSEVQQAYTEALWFSGKDTLRVYDAKIGSLHSPYMRMSTETSGGRIYGSSGFTSGNGAFFTYYGVGDPSFDGSIRALRGPDAAEGWRVDSFGRNFFSADSTYTPGNFNRPDSGNFLNLYRNGVCLSSFYASTVNTQIVAGAGTHLALSTRTTSDETTTPNIRFRLVGVTAGDETVGDFVPDSNNAYSIGTPSRRLKKVWTNSINVAGLPVYANNTEAASLTPGDMYRTSSGQLMVRY